MNDSGNVHEMEMTDAERPRTCDVMLRLLIEVREKYECGAAELSAEFELPEIRPELLMHVCLAAPEVDDLMLGFIRDDLQVVSLSDQTRRMVDRDIGLLQRDPSRTLDMGSGSLGRQLSVMSRADADARVAMGRSSELEKFILENPDVYESVRGLRPSDLVRWVMLSLMRETKARERGSGVIAAWREKLGPEMKKRVEAMKVRFGNNQAPRVQEGPKANQVMKPAAKLGF